MKAYVNFFSPVNPRCCGFSSFFFLIYDCSNISTDLFQQAKIQTFFFVVVLQYGGFGKTPEQLPDLYHAYYGFCAFSMLEEPGLKSICTELGITNGPVQLL